MRPQVKKIVFHKANPHTIFGSVGRSGGGYNTKWSDWTEEGIEKRNKICKEFEIGMNQICRHYELLEENILKNGFIEPLIITYGTPLYRGTHHVPNEFRGNKFKRMLMLESLTGGSRLWVAQKHNMPIPCIINDYVGNYEGDMIIKDLKMAKNIFNDHTIRLMMNNRRGVYTTFNPRKQGKHLENPVLDSQITVRRAPLWVSIMNKYGYRVDDLGDKVEKILQQSGIDQDKALAEYHGT